MINKAQDPKTPAEIFIEAVNGQELSIGDLRLLASGYVALKEAYDRPVNHIELNALTSMLVYVAQTENVSEAMINEMFVTHYNISQPKELPSRQYQDAIEFLINLELGKVVN